MKKTSFIFLLIFLLSFYTTIDVFASERAYNVSINNSARYKIETFQWNSEYDQIDNKSITLEGKEIILKANVEFTLKITSVGPNALLCNFETESESINVICSDNFLSPYFPKLIFSVYTTPDEWQVYSDAITTSNSNIDIQVDDKYYQETSIINLSTSYENKFIQFNSQNGFLFDYYYQYYEDSNFKNYKEIKLKRIDQDFWKTSSPQIEATTPFLDITIVFSSILFILTIRKYKS